MDNFNLYRTVLRDYYEKNNLDDKLSVNISNNGGKFNAGGVVYPWQAPIIGFNVLANSLANLKKEKEFDEYDRIQNMEIQQPETSYLNRFSRYGTFEEGGSVLVNNMIGLSKNTGYVPEMVRLEEQVNNFSSSIAAGVDPVPDVTESASEETSSEEASIVYNDYKNRADKYLQARGAVGITGSQLARAAVNAYEKYGQTVPLELALAQLTQEGYLAKGSKQNKPQRTKNPFNVGNVDSGAVVEHDSVMSGVQSYYDLMAKSYLRNKDAKDLLNNFVDSRGRRYATDKNYEKSLREHIKNINKIIYK